jgi:hypothetical protein
VERGNDGTGHVAAACQCATHDDKPPSEGELKTALGDLRQRRTPPKAASSLLVLVAGGQQIVEETLRYLRVLGIDNDAPRLEIRRLGERIADFLKKLGRMLAQAGGSKRRPRIGL